MGKITREFPLSACAIIASLSRSLVLMVLSFLSPVVFGLCVVVFLQFVYALSCHLSIHVYRTTHNPKTTRTQKQEQLEPSTPNYEIAKL
jgi:Ca2+/Na+ antiporter